MTMESFRKVLGPLWLLLLHRTLAHPSSKPYIPFRTSPFDQEGTLDHEIDWDEETLTSHRSLIHSHDAVSADKCPLQFSLGISKRLHSGSDPGHAIRQPPVIHPVYPARGPGRQVIYTTQYEHLDLLSPATLETPGQTIKEALLQASDFPLLLESSSFHSSPILHDVNGDGIMDAIVADYDGGIYIMGLAGNPRYFHKTQVPRLYIRRQWVESRVNETLKRDQPPPPQKNENETKADDDKPDEPYHSYFEYLYGSEKQGEDVLRGVTANLLGQEHEQVQALDARRSRLVTHERQQSEAEGKGEPDEKETENENAKEEKEEEEQNVKTEEKRKSRKQDGQDEGKQKSEKQQEQKDEIEKDQDEGKQKSEKQQEQKDEIEKDQDEGKQKSEKQQEQKDEIEKDHRRLEEASSQKEKDSAENEEVDQVNQAQDAGKSGEEASPKDEDGSVGERLKEIDKERDLSDADDPAMDDIYEDEPEPPEARRRRRNNSPDASGDGDDFAMDDPDYGRNRFYDDEYARYREDYDDRYGGYNAAHEEYYDSKHYIRIPPHILCTPTLAEIPKLYGNQNEMEDILFVAVSYYLDEDEYQGFFSYKRFDETDQGDETEVKRGSYVASALMAYIIGDSTRWSGQTHLDLSTDFSAPENVTIVGALPIQEDVSQMGAFALGSPTVADLDGDGSLEVLLGTSMGIVYAFDARQMYKRDKWPIQMKKPVESRILVEDVVGNTNLEVFVADTGGTIVCFSHDARRIWNRNLVSSLGIDARIAGSSPMTLGDVDGDGTMDLVIVVSLGNRLFLFAMNAATGEDLPNFPIELEKDPKSDDSDELHEKLVQPLLVDLHADQSFLDDYLRRNGTKWTKRSVSGSSKPPHGGSAPGLHIVQPVGEELYVIEAGSGCSQKVSIGDKITTMVQVDDVHGTNRLDLVVSTESGNIVTLESASPFHPLNTWNHGDLRGRMNANAHGYSASQGIFVHEVSRQFVDIFGVYVPITFQIFDNRPGASQEPDRRKYIVEIRAGPSYKRALFRNEYTAPGVYTERVYVRFGPGYYSLQAVMKTSHGLVFEDSFQIGYNVNFLNGFGVLLWLPLCIAGTAILFCGVKKSNWEDEEDDAREGRSGILGRALPT